MAGSNEHSFVADAKNWSVSVGSGRSENWTIGLFDFSCFDFETVFFVPSYMTGKMR
jgi:hypothetical protein